MGILGNILSKIFPSAHAGSKTTSSGTPQVPGAQPTSPAAAPASAASSGTAAPAPQAISRIDVEKLLNEKASAAGEKLNWRTSIVDLMKLLDLDSSLAARKELAKELNYSGDTNDSAAMNIWLHRQVMNKVAENGGNVPADLKD